MTDSNQTIPEIINRDIAVPKRDYTSMDMTHLRTYAMNGNGPAQVELERRRNISRGNNNLTGNKGIPRRRLVVYDDNTEVEHDE